MKSSFLQKQISRREVLRWSTSSTGTALLTPIISTRLLGILSIGGGSAVSDLNPVPDAVGLPDAQRLFSSGSGGFGMSFFELDCFWPNLGLTKPLHEDSIVIGPQLRTSQDFDLYLNGRMIRPEQFNAGLAIYDLRTPLAFERRDPLREFSLFLGAAHFASNLRV